MSDKLVFGNRFRGLSTDNWKDLETVSGWDKGYWAAEHTDVECRGWRPGWSNKVKSLKNAKVILVWIKTWEYFKYHFGYFAVYICIHSIKTTF